MIFSTMKITTATFLCLIFITPVFAIVLLECALGEAPAAHCPLDGGWATWSSWGPCEGECGSVGHQSRVRNCSNPLPGEGGEACSGHQREVDPCGVPGCTYEMYQKLLAGDIVKLLELRTLQELGSYHSALVAKCIVSHCYFHSVSQAIGVAATKFWNALQCVKKDTGCPVAGGWGAWSEWTRCSARCGEGLQMRCRVCCDPPPSSQEMVCLGEPCERQQCIASDCVRGLKEEGVWSDWSDWSACNSKCHFGIKRRSRRCMKATQNQKRKTFSNLKGKDDLQLYDDADHYYDSYLYDGYGLDKTINDYEEEVAENADSLWRINKRSQDKCDTKVEYYSTEDDEEYSTTVGLTSKIPPTTSLGRKIKSTTKTHVPTPDDETESLKNDNRLKTTKVLKHTTNKKSKTDSTTFQTIVDNKESTSEIPQEESSDINTKTSTHTLKSESDNDFETTEECRTSKSTKKATTRIVLKTTKPSSVRKTRSTAKYRTGKTLADEECDSAFGEGQDTTVVRPDTQCTGELYKDQEEVSGESHYSSELNDHTTETTTAIRKTEKKKTLPPTTTIEHFECTTIKCKEDVSVLETISSTSVTRETSSSRFSIPSTATTQNTEDFGNLHSTSEINGTSSSEVFEPLANSTVMISLTSTTSYVSSSSTLGYNNTLQNNTELEQTDEEISAAENGTTLTVIYCDLSKKLVLPSFNDNFEVDNCKGPFEEIEHCNIRPCSEDGGWSSWSAWSACSPYCGLGHQISTRSCTNPEPKSQGTTCPGDTSWKRSCFLKPCPVKVVTHRAMLAIGDSFIRYNDLHHHQNLLHVFVKFRHLNSSGNLVSRDREFHRVRLSLYNSRVLLSVRVKKCYTNILSAKDLSVGDWHEVMFTVVGAVVTLRVDDSVLPLRNHMSCRPRAPNYDADMKVGGHFLGEVDRLIVNFVQYSLQSSYIKRDTWVDTRDSGVKPVESTGVQYELNSVETVILSLAQFIQSPCFVNESKWTIELSMKPQLTSGVVLIVRGYGRNDVLSVTLDHSRLRLRVKVAGLVGECVQPLSVAPHTWLHLWLGKHAADRPIEMVVNGGERCVLNLAGFDFADEPTIRCTGSIYLGEVPLSLKKLLDPSEPDTSPLGVLGELSVDRHRMDLERLPRKLGPDLVNAHPSSRFLFSSEVSSSTTYYEEVMLFPNETLSLMCLYDVTGNDSNGNLYSHDHDLDTVQYSTSWLKLDLPVETVFEKNRSEVQYRITDGGRSSRLDVYSYTNREIVEGFYSCWLHYPYPLQPGLNIITYGVIVFPSFQDLLGWWLATVHLVFTVLLLVFFLVWLIAEAVWNFKNKYGLYRSAKLDAEKIHNGVHRLIFCDKGVAMLGGLDAAHRAYQRYLRFQVADELGEDTYALDTTEKVEPGHIRISILKQEGDRDGSIKDKVTAPALPEDGFFQSPPRNLQSPPRNLQSTPKKRSPPKLSDSFKSASSIDLQSPPRNLQSPPRNVQSPPRNLQSTPKKRSPPKLNYSFKSASSIDRSGVSLQQLQDSDPEDVPDRVRAGSEAAGSGDNLIDVLDEWQEKMVRRGNIGHIQDTSAFRSIENELKFMPEKLKELGKYQTNSKPNK